MKITFILEYKHYIYIMYIYNRANDQISNSGYIVMINIIKSIMNISLKCVKFK
jgi:hypothetical protein